MEYIRLILTSALLVQVAITHSDADFYELPKNLDYDYSSDVSYRDNKPFMSDPMLSGLDLQVSEDHRSMETDIERKFRENAFNRKNLRNFRRRPYVKRKKNFPTKEDFEDLEAEDPNVISYKKNKKYFDGKHQSRDRREKVPGLQRKIKKKSILTKGTIDDFEYDEKTVTEKRHDLNYEFQEETNTERKKIPRGVKRLTPITYGDSKVTDISTSEAAVIDNGQSWTSDADLANDLSGRREAHKQFLNALKKNHLDKFFTTSISEDFEKIYKFPVTRRMQNRDEEDFLKTTITETPNDDTDSKLMKYFTSEILHEFTDNHYENLKTDPADEFDNQILNKYFSPNQKSLFGRKSKSNPKTPAIVIVTGPEDFFNFEYSTSQTYKSPIIYYTRTAKPQLRSNKTSNNSTTKYYHKTAKPLIMYKLAKEQKPTVMVLDSGYNNVAQNKYRDFFEDRETIIAKRIMRERLLKNTRAFEDLLTGGDEEICDYIDNREFISSSLHYFSNFPLILFVFYTLFYLN